jgi:cytochrome c-type biogenesis protein CcmH/NrfF
MTIYFWFVPVFLLLVLGVVVLYFIVGRGLPKTSDRSVADALAEDEAPPRPPTEPGPKA